jgi:hypothetical protein
MNNDTTTPTTAPRPMRGGRDEEPAETRASQLAAGEVSALARHRDPSLSKSKTAATEQEAKQKRPGVEWVRPSELLASRSARVAGRGIDFQAELARRTRQAPGHVVRGTRRGVRAGARFVSERARRLPPVSDFGRGAGPTYSWVSRSGIGLG